MTLGGVVLIGYIIVTSQLLGKIAHCVKFALLSVLIEFVDLSE